MPVKKFKDPFIGKDSTTREPRCHTKPPKRGSHTPLRASEVTASESSLSMNKSLTILQHTPTVRYSKEHLKERWNTLSGRLMDYLLEKNPKTGLDNLELLLRETKLKDIGILLGISTEKVLLMEGQPTQIVGYDERKKLDELLPALLNEVKRRGSTVELTERKASIKLDKK